LLENLATGGWFLVAICILVAIHEYGHFIVARWCGVKVLRFSIGFGKPLLRYTGKHGTEFVISAIPLGGYVKMLGENDSEFEESERNQSFGAKSVWQRIAIAAAGPVANFLLAILLYWVLFLQGTVSYSPVIGSVEPGSIAAQAGLEVGQEIMSIDGIATPSRRAVSAHLITRLGESGEITFTYKYTNDSDLVYESSAIIDEWLRTAEEPDLIKGLGINFFFPISPKVVGLVLADTPAEAAGFKLGDELLASDGQAIETWVKWVDYVKARAGQPIETTVMRNGKLVVLTVTPESIKDNTGATIGRIGMGPEAVRFPEDMRRAYDHGVLGAAAKAVQETIDTSYFLVISLKKLVIGDISTKNLSGPIGIAKVAADRARHGTSAFISFLAYLSVVLGVMNLLPIPILDGGQIVYCLVEALKGSPASLATQAWGQKIGLAMLAGVMFLAFYNDIMRL